MPSTAWPPAPTLPIEPSPSGMRANFFSSTPKESTSSSAEPSSETSKTACSSEPSRLMMISWMARSTSPRSRLSCSRLVAT